VSERISRFGPRQPLQSLNRSGRGPISAANESSVAKIVQDLEQTEIIELRLIAPGNGRDLDMADVGFQFLPGSAAWLYCKDIAECC
jgi:hypothetical protein